MSIPSESYSDKKQNAFYKLVFCMPNPLFSVKTKYFLGFCYETTITGYLPAEGQEFLWTDNRYRDVP
jgi:hypothetical protein